MKFIKSALFEDDFIKDSKSEVCFIGRSNVGKSSLINALANNKIAKVSSSPGRTQLINYFDCGNFNLVDLPGYGFANVSKQKKDQLVYLVETYIHKSKNLKAIFQVCDAGVIMPIDIEMSKYFNRLNVKHYIILNKIDKHSGNYKNNFNKICSTLEVSLDNVILTSAKKAINIKKLNQMLVDSCK